LRTPFKNEKNEFPAQRVRQTSEKSLRQSKKMSENFSENPCNQPKHLFFLDFSIVFARFSLLPRLFFSPFACIMRVFHSAAPLPSPKAGSFRQLNDGTSATPKV
jgi:hypothetical protein